MADGDLAASARLLGPGGAVGIRWPIEHVIDGAAVVVVGEVPDLSLLVLEVFDGCRWVPVSWGTQCRAVKERRRIEWTFEPTSTRAIRVRWSGTGSGSGTSSAGDTAAAVPIAEIEVYRYLPADRSVWPERLIGKVGLRQEILGSAEEPSFESVALGALPMPSARALLGLKDDPREIGVARDGTIIARDRVGFCFGPPRARLAEFPDVVRRRLIDAWRPGCIVEGRIGDLKVRQTAFVAPAGNDGVGPALMLRVRLRNLSDQPMKTCVQAEVLSDRPEGLQYRDGALLRSDKVVFVPLSASRAGESDHAFCNDLDLGPGEEGHADYVYLAQEDAPQSTLGRLRGLTFEGSLADFRRYWDDVLRVRAAIETPEPRINRMVKAVLAQVFVNGDGSIMPYGAAPSVYDGALFGLEEGYPIIALAEFGFQGDAQRYLDGTYLTRDFMRKSDRYRSPRDRHQQYRNGLVPHYAVSAYRLRRDAAWIRRHVGLLKECAEWTIAQRRRTMVLEDGQRPLHWGLLPKWAYGGDIHQLVCYPLYANVCCWRGLKDTAWLLRELGDKETARRYADDARDYLAAIERAIAGSYRKDRDPPFFPLRVYGEEPDEKKDFYQLFGGCLLDLEALEIGGEQLGWMTSFLEEDNRTFCFLPRYRSNGAGGLDALYGKGYFLTKLHEGVRCESSRREFLLALYAYLAFNMDRETFVSRESNVLYASDLHAESVYGEADPIESSDPLPCASAVALHLVRNGLVTEERDGAGAYSGNLLLLAGVPRRWFADGRRVRITDMPTQFGPVSLEVTSSAGTGLIEAMLRPPRRNPPQVVKLRLPHPEGQPLREAVVNGNPWPQVEPEDQWILLPGGEGPYRIEARYQ